VTESALPDQRWKAGLLVSAQILLLAANLLPRRRHEWPTPPWLRTTASAAGAVGAITSATAALALSPGLTASPLPNERTVLHDQGPYGVVRHPIYSGLLLTVGARTLSSGDRRQLGVFALLAALLHYKATFEERILTQKYPEYAEYAARTPRLVPQVIKRQQPSVDAVAGHHPRGWRCPP
jgi:protein-S-isoprenylcysteine O-methyltransferase Ste14